MNVTAYDIAQRFVGIKEVKGSIDNPLIMAMLKLDATWPEHDEVPWCSAFANWPAWLLRLPRSKSLRARSWLEVGTPVSIDAARQGWDVVILKQQDEDPGPDVIEFRGHVGFFSSVVRAQYSYNYVNNITTTITHVNVLGGNQSNQVSVAEYPISRLLGVRRLYIE